VLYQTGRLAEARAILERVAEERPFGDNDMVNLMARIGYIAILQGDEERAASIEEFLTRPQRPYVFGTNTAHRARMAALRDRKDDAMRFLRQARSEGLTFDHTMHTAFELQRLRGHAPFQEWLRPKG
jgi:hypothetical protein